MPAELKRPRKRYPSDRAAHITSQIARLKRLGVSWGEPDETGPASESPTYRLHLPRRIVTLDDYDRHR